MRGWVPTVLIAGVSGGVLGVLASVVFPSALGVGHYFVQPPMHYAQVFCVLGVVGATCAPRRPRVGAWLLMVSGLGGPGLLALLAAALLVIFGITTEFSFADRHGVAQFITHMLLVVLVWALGVAALFLLAARVAFAGARQEPINTSA